jgi:hypothetical protein
MPLPLFQGGGNPLTQPPWAYTIPADER